ncbi:MAG: polyprenyl diphosphate synthase [Leptospiraceae bacterium]|nr:polyprenyl diphosphate synthase [Leptospiraceae bacterium]
MEKIPKHVAVIMDGNGRWATQRGLARLEGHRQGAENIERLLDTLFFYKIPVVSLYAFSTENWRRPQSEVKGLFSLLNEFLEKKLPVFHEKKIQLRVSGELTRLPARSRKAIEKAIEETKSYRRLVANFCINYGAHYEICRAAVLACRDLLCEKDKIRPNLFERYLYTAGLPPVDLLIRTGGQKRLSNFLLYQIAYAELYFTDVLWPDFSPGHLEEALVEYNKRTRKFGGLVTEERDSSS